MAGAAEKALIVGLENSFGSDCFSVIATLVEKSDSWDIEITEGEVGRSGNKRLRLAVAQLCQLDAAIILKLKSNGSVSRTVSKSVDASDGRHTATELILPLLLPNKIDDDLYTYQRQGAAWLCRRQKALLGDDMGLGKTAQAIAAARRLIRSGRVFQVLVVSPRTLISNWIDEVRHWAPELTTATALPLGSERDKVWSHLIKRAHFLITSYEQIREPIPALQCAPPELVIVDEAHRLRNFGSLATKGFRRIPCKRIWALTGTPIERDPEDVVTLLSILEPAKYSPADKSLPSTSLTAQLRKYLLRRRKQDVLKQLPQVVELTETLDLTEEQKIAYDAAINQTMRESSDIGFLRLFNTLRMLCDIDLATGQSSKINRTIELIGDIYRYGEKVVVFSYVIEPLNRLHERLQQIYPNIGCVKLIGSMSLQERKASIREFKENPEICVLLASTRIASEGLTLTEANHVIFVNRWWNPSANAQARDRVVRIGQKRLVTVYSFTIRGTVEERLVNILQKKSMTFEELIESLSKSAEELLSVNFSGST